MNSDTLIVEVPLAPRNAVNGAADMDERRMEISERLDYLATVEDGWFEGRGVVIDRMGLRWLGQQMADHFVGTDLPLPFIFPTVPGGVMVEWSTERFEGAIEIDLESRTGLWVDVDLETGEGIDERVLDLSDDTDWDWMVGRLRRFMD